MSTPEVHIDAIAVGGEGVGRLPDGRVTFVEGAVPGDVVGVEIVDERRRFARGRLERLLEAGPTRAEPSCPAVALGCGGCDWQHVAVEARAGHHVAMVHEQLRRQLPNSPVEVRHAGSVPHVGYRSTIRLAVDEQGRPGFRRATSHDVVHHGACEVAVASLQPVLRADWTGATELSARASVADSRALVVVTPSVAALSSVPDLGDDVRIIGRDELDEGRRAWLFDEAVGHRWRLSADSFFQSGPWAVELLVSTVGERLAEPLGAAETAADLYGGVGVLAGGLSATLDVAPRWTLVESSPSAIADARVNLADLDAVIRRSSVERWRPTRQHVVVADPPRAGLGPDGVARVGATRARDLALVSCDLLAFGRDLRRLTDGGWTLASVDVLDLFPGTVHVEVVSTYRRGGGGGRPG